MIGRLSGTLLSILASACTGHRPPIDPGTVPAGVVVDARLQYYEVSASSLAELRRAMVQLGPRWEGRSYQAVTASRFTWDFQVQRSAVAPQRCKPARVRVTVHTTVTFPRWNPSAEPDSATLEWWHQLNAGLMEHERGHARLSVKTAGEIARALDDMPSVPCEELDRRVASEGQSRIDLERRRQIQYDQVTRHGATQIEMASRLRSP